MRGSHYWVVQFTVIQRSDKNAVMFFRVCVFLFACERELLQYNTVYGQSRNVNTHRKRIELNENERFFIDKQADTRLRFIYFR